MKKIWALLFVVCFVIGFVGQTYGTKHPMVSVVMPTYNRADLVGRAIESILMQTYPDFELIIVDDGSTDETLKIVKRYAKKDSRIVVISTKENNGIASARNAGNAKARGKYIMIMDSDDISLPYRMAEQVKFMEENPQIAIVTSIKRDLNGKFYNSAPLVGYEPYLLYAHYLGHPEWMVRADFVKRHKIQYNPALDAGVDYEYLYQIVKNHGKIGYVNKVLLLRRVHQSNTSEYYQVQRRASLQTAEKFKALFGIPEELRDFSKKCLAYQHAVNVNKTQHYFDQNALEKAMTKCFEEEAKQRNKTLLK